MKKMLLPVVVCVCCLGATNVFAQAQKETTQEKIFRLEVENKVLNEQITSLTNQISSLTSQIGSLRSELATEKAKNAQQPNQLIHNSRPTFSNNQRASSTNQKPQYYMTAEIHQIMRRYPKTAQWAKEMYNSDKSFKIIEAQEYLCGWKLEVTYMLQGQKHTTIRRERYC